MRKIIRNSKLSLLAIALMISFSAFAGGDENEANKKENHVILAYDLDNAHVEIDYLSVRDFNTDQNLTLKNVKPAKFDLSRNMEVNGTHVTSGHYVVSLIETTKGLAFNFHNQDNKQNDIQVELIASQGTYSEWLKYSLEVTEPDKIEGNFNWKENSYSFELEVSLSNYIFAELAKVESAAQATWLDFYQAGIYSYSRNIDIQNSFKYAKKAYKKEQNGYTTKLMALYLTALGRESEATKFSNVVAIR